MKHFANFIGSPSQVDDNAFLSRLKVPLAGLGGQAAGGAIGICKGSSTRQYIFSTSYVN
jgi:hypothetical protein